MSPAEVESHLESVVRKHTRLQDLGSISPAARLGPDCGLDSLALVMAITELEDRLSFEFPLEQAEELRELTFGQALSLVRTAMGMAGGEPRQ